MKEKFNMRYPDTLKLYFIEPKKKIGKAELKLLDSILSSFGGVVVTHSYRCNAGIEYNLRNVKKWDDGRIVLDLYRKDDGDVPDNLK